MARPLNLPPFPESGHRELLEKLEELSDRPMSARSAAEFLDLGPDAFKKLAPKLPRCKLSESRYVYLKSDLLAYLKARREAPEWFYREVV
jgi:hypothetical protein